jgi:cell division protein FtsW
MIERRWETRLLAVVAMALSMIGIIAVYGASSLVVGSTLALNQVTGLLVGGVVATIVARFDYHVWQRYAWPLLGVVAVLLVVPVLPFTHSIAPVVNGARRWVYLGPLRLQPSELGKLAVVVWTAMLAAKKGEQMRSFERGILPVMVIVAPIVALIFLEPNLSMALLVTLLAGVVMFAAGAKIGHFLLLAVGLAPLAFGAVATAQYRLARVLTFLNSGGAPSEATWQVHQSLVGIGAGQLFGVGIGQGQQKLGYLPYAYNDFIFSTLGEEWGFLGVVGLVLGFSLFVWLGFRIARSARDAFGQLLAAGLTALFALSAILHIGVNLAVLPATGMTLPFVSSGRSSLLVALIATGILVSIGQGRGGASAPAAPRLPRRARAGRRA